MKTLDFKNNEIQQWNINGVKRCPLHKTKQNEMPWNKMKLTLFHQQGQYKMHWIWRM